MKLKKLLLLPLVLFVASCSPTSELTTSHEESLPEPTTVEQPPNKVDVIVLAGQSNMEGHSWNNELKKHVSEEKYNEYLTGYEDILMSYKGGCTGTTNTSSGMFKPVKLGQGCTVAQYGPELGMAEYFNDYKDSLINQVMFIKFTVGGTTIYNDWRSPSSVTETKKQGYLYSPFIEYVTQAMSVLEHQEYDATIRGICWMQGESDGGAFAKEYEELEDNFINDVVNDLAEFNKEDKIKFIDAGIYNSSWVTNYQIINHAKIKNANKDPDYRFYFDTIEAGLEYRNEPEGNVDIYHFDSESMIQLGRMFAETILLEYVI